MCGGFEAYAKALREKDEQIEQLMQEGQKLSKNEFNQLSVIKKLRAKDKESEETLTGIRAELKKATGELDELKKVLDGKESVEKQNDGEVLFCFRFLF
jgi:septal ring factor EnvC (AmiA/AmiB activator)